MKLEMIMAMTILLLVTACTSTNDAPEGTDEVQITEEASSVVEEDRTIEVTDEQAVPESNKAEDGEKDTVKPEELDVKENQEKPDSEKFQSPEEEEHAAPLPQEDKAQGEQPATPEMSVEDEQPAPQETAELNESVTSPKEIEEEEDTRPELPDGGEEGTRPESPKGGKGGRSHGHDSNDSYTNGTRISLDGSQSYRDGTYTGTATGYQDGLTVSVTIKNNVLTDIAITDHNESRGFYEDVFALLPDQIITGQSTDVDTVSGATRSSEGFIVAVENALAQALIEEE